MKTIKYIFFKLVLIFLFSKCSSTSINKFTSKEISKTLNASYDKVWTATINELYNFTLKSSNYDTGTIITETIMSNEKLNSFNNSIYVLESYFYINISSISTNPYKTKVGVTKYSKLLNTNKVIGTDYIDEEILLYRIKRNLELQRKNLGYY